jgi:hypothetical protein
VSRERQPLARAGRTVARLGVLEVFVGIAWSGLRWLSAPGEDEPRGSRGNISGTRCGICELVAEAIVAQGR